ncbi:uncharacterized protein LOC113147231 [Cyclospora cayetanensis]|uniref:Uncharacterized protein LOC113147231 n=1 Tax=Cyclospora cayetanensis TaxID=88456 RepID=A0A6P6RYA2_9EIME|nr:uncharacterized protein LOC113147231 [Cyclospora cayetanensis]
MEQPVRLLGFVFLLLLAVAATQCSVALASIDPLENENGLPSSLEGVPQSEKQPDSTPETDEAAAAAARGDGVSVTPADEFATASEEPAAAASEGGRLSEPLDAAESDGMTSREDADRLEDDSPAADAAASAGDSEEPAVASSEAAEEAEVGRSVTQEDGIFSADKAGQAEASEEASAQSETVKQRLEEEGDAGGFKAEAAASEAA